MQVVRLTATGTTAETAATFRPEKGAKLVHGDMLVLVRADTLVPDEVGGIAIPDVNIGDAVTIFPTDRMGASVRVYLPADHSYYVSRGKSSDPFTVSKVPVPLTLTKVGASEWTIF